MLADGKGETSAGSSEAMGVDTAGVGSGPLSVEGSLSDRDIARKMMPTMAMATTPPAMADRTFHAPLAGADGAVMSIDVTEGAVSRPGVRT
jgi:hypothetical protein